MSLGSAWKPLSPGWCEVAQLLPRCCCSVVCALWHSGCPCWGVTQCPSSATQLQGCPRWGTAAGWQRGEQPLRRWPCCVPCRGELPHRHGHDRHGAGLQQPQQRRGSHGRHHEPAGGRRGARRPRGLQRPALAPVTHPAPNSQVHLLLELCGLWNSWDWEAFMWELHKSCVRMQLILPCVTSDKVE